MRRRSVLIKRILAAAILALPAVALADLGKFDVDARIYTKHLYQNDDSQGLLTYGNPFWPDDVAGRNGVGTELELAIRGRVSQQVETGARLASRFGERWQDWWESGNSFYDGELNTSGDSAGMNRASYLKLRGTYIQASPAVWGVDWVRVGASDFSMFNPWTIGKVRYIDRDNGRGYFISGRFGKDDALQYHLGAIAMPKLYVGPGWSTGIGDPALANAFWSRDWAYAASLRWRVGDATTVRLVADLTQDLEVDLADPDAVGSTNATCKDKLGHDIPGCAPDHAVDLLTRYQSANATFDVEHDFSDTLRLTGLVAFSQQRIDPNLASNGVALNQGVFPLVFNDTSDIAGTLRLSANDPMENGFSLQAEYFNIGADYNAIFGARREADVLLTDGFVGTGGQLPTLNLANEFIDFDDEWVESCIGWHGGTGLFKFEKDDLRVTAEYSFIGFNTNRQNRDVDNVYPDFLHGDGFTDTAIYDYANVTDRGREPRSVYRRNQFRRSHIAVLQGHHLVDLGRGLEIDWKGKFIRDEDFRANGLDNVVPGGGETDDYKGDIAIGRLKAGLPVADGVKVALLGQVERWQEQNRRGTLELGYGDDETWKRTIAAQVHVLFGGLRVAYHLEHVGKMQDREREADQEWSVWRSKATLEAAW